MKKVRSESKLASKPLLYTLPNLFFNWNDMHDFEARWKRYTLEKRDHFDVSLREKASLRSPEKVMANLLYNRGVRYKSNI